MKTVGIIAEFNPFHNGHAYLINQDGIATVKGLEIIDRLREEHRPTDRNNKHDR